MMANCFEKPFIAVKKAPINSEFNLLSILSQKLLKILEYKVIPLSL